MLQSVEGEEPINVNQRQAFNCQNSCFKALKINGLHDEEHITHLLIPFEKRLTGVGMVRMKSTREVS